MQASPVPPAVRALVGAETLERLAFHGLTAVLVLYMNEHLLWPERDARAWYHAFLIAAYLAPLAGGWLAERALGRRRALLAVTALWALGAAAAALWSTREGLLAGLLLVAAGAGGLKPAASALLGEGLAGAAPLARERVYRWLYWAVHLGAAAARLIVPVLLVAFGPAVAFAVPAALVLAALALLRRVPAVEPAPAPAAQHGFARVVARAVSRLGTGHPGQHWLDLARDVHPAEAVEGAKAVLRLAPIFAAVTVFWALLDQRGSSWIFQARQMDLAILGRFLSPAQLQALHPLLVLAAVPLLSRVFPALARRGIALPPARRVAAGLVAAGLAFAAAGVVQLVLDGGRAPHALWQLPQYALLAVAEVLVAVTGLEFGYTQAPRAMRATIMSIWFVTIAAGNLLTVLATKLFRLDGPAWYWTFAALMLAASVGFRALSRAWSAAPAPGLAPE